MSEFNLPLRAVPRTELEVSGQRVIEDANGDEIAYVGFDEHAEALARAVNGYAELHAEVGAFLNARVSLSKSYSQIIRPLVEAFDRMEKP